MRLSRDCDIVARKYDFSLRSAENDLSAVEVVIGIVKKIFNSFLISENSSWHTCTSLITSEIFKHWKFA